MTEAEKAKKKALAMTVLVVAIGGLGGYLVKRAGGGKGSTLVYMLGGIAVIGAIVWGTSKVVDYNDKG